jgi:hypothetical protein
MHRCLHTRLLPPLCVRTKHRPCFRRAPKYHCGATPALTSSNSMSSLATSAAAGRLAASASQHSAISRFSLGGQRSALKSFLDNRAPLYVTCDGPDGCANQSSMNEHARILLACLLVERTACTARIRRQTRHTAADTQQHGYIPF